MKKVFGLVLVLGSLLFSSIPVANAYVSVKGYYRSNGTYVAPHVRSNPNGIKYDNYSYTSSQDPYNKTYGTRDSYWNTPTSITDPNYYLGQSIYSSGNSSYSSSYSTTPSCPSNSYYDGVSSCNCYSGYINSGGSCVSASSMCYSQTGYNSSYDSLSNSCKCDTGYVIGSSGQCANESIVYDNWCSSNVGTMSRYNSISKKCECLNGYEYNGSACVSKTNYSNSSSYSSYNNCPLNSHQSLSESIKCECNTGYQVNQTKTACVLISNTYTQSVQDDKTIGINYFIQNKTCVGVKDNERQYSECISYAYNH